MSLFTSLVLSTFLLNPIIKMDSLKTIQPVRVLTDKRVVEEVDNVYVANAHKLQEVMVKFNYGILFPNRETTLNSSAKDALTKLSEILIKNPATEISITGHTDNISSLELNQNLSENRAQVVADFLISKNVASKQFKGITGKNYSEPVANNSTEAGRAANRRVEIYFVSSALITNPLVSAISQKESVKSKVVPTFLKNLVDQTIKHPLKSSEVEIEIDGFLVDDTKTKAGRDFYDLFYAGWEAPKSAKNYSITVTEKPFRLTSTLIVVSINDDIVYQDVVQPRQDLIENQVEDAVSVTQDYLTNYDEIMKQLNGEDLGGSGIY